MQFLLSEMALNKWSQCIQYTPAMEEMTLQPMSLVYFTNDTFDIRRFQNTVQTWQKRTDVHYNSKEHLVLVLITVAASGFLNDSVVAQALHDTVDDALSSPMAHVVVYVTKSHSHCLEALTQTFDNALRRQQLQIIVDTTTTMGAAMHQHMDHSMPGYENHHDMTFAYLLHLAHVVNLEYTLFLTAGTVLKKKSQLQVVRLSRGDKNENYAV